MLRFFKRTAVFGLVALAMLAIFGSPAQAAAKKKTPTACGFAIPKEAVRFVGSNCRIPGDVLISSSPNGPFRRYFDDDASTGHVVHMAASGYVFAPFSASTTTVSDRVLIARGCGGGCLMRRSVWPSDPGFSDIVGEIGAPGGGRWVVHGDGGVFAYGAPFYGSYWCLTEAQNVATRRFRSIEPTPQGGYVITSTHGEKYTFNPDSRYCGIVPAPAPAPAAAPSVVPSNPTTPAPTAPPAFVDVCFDTIGKIAARNSAFVPKGCSVKGDVIINGVKFHDNNPATCQITIMDEGGAVSAPYGADVSSRTPDSLAADGCGPGITVHIKRWPSDLGKFPT